MKVCTAFYNCAKYRHLHISVELVPTLSLHSNPICHQLSHRGSLKKREGKTTFGANHGWAIIPKLDFLDSLRCVRVGFTHGVTIREKEMVIHVNFISPS
jgi:hypothetical protein